jgi:hypothetical protein
MFAVIARFTSGAAHVVYTNDVEPVRAYYLGFGDHLVSLNVWTRKAA